MLHLDLIQGNIHRKLQKINNKIAQVYGKTFDLHSGVKHKASPTVVEQRVSQLPAKGSDFANNTQLEKAIEIKIMS